MISERPTLKRQIGQVQQQAGLPYHTGELDSRGRKAQRCAWVRACVSLSVCARAPVPVCVSLRPLLGCSSWKVEGCSWATAMSERRGGPVDLYSVGGQRDFERALMVEAGFLGGSAQRRGVTPKTWMNTCEPRLHRHDPSCMPAVGLAWVDRAVYEEEVRYTHDL